jgi:DNA-binding transcriptional regulator WhiA
MEWQYTEKLSGALLHLMLDDAVQTQAQQGIQYTRGALLACGSMAGAILSQLFV